MLTAILYISKIHEDLNFVNILHNEILDVEQKLPKLSKIALVNMTRPASEIDTASPNKLYSCLS